MCEHRHLKINWPTTISTTNFLRLQNMFDLFSFSSPIKIHPHSENNDFRNNPQLLNAINSKATTITFIGKSWDCEGGEIFPKVAFWEKWAFKICFLKILFCKWSTKDTPVGRLKIWIYQWPRMAKIDTGYLKHKKKMPLNNYLRH